MNADLKIRSEISACYMWADTDFDPQYYLGF